MKVRAALVGMAVLGTLACGGDGGGGTVCTPGTTNACVCDDGRMGSQVCLLDGSGFGACMCAVGDAGPPPVDTGPADTGPADTGPADTGPRDTGGPSGCSVLVDATGFGVTDSCTGNDVCVCPSIDESCSTSCDLCQSPGTCQPAFPRRYRLVPFFAAVPVTKSTGEGWDGDGSGPDLFAAMSVDGAGRFTTATANDLTLDAEGAFSAVYTGTSSEFNLIGGSAIKAEVIDEDALADDPAFECNWSADPLLARTRLLECEGDLGGFAAWMFAL